MRKILRCLITLSMVLSLTFLPITYNICSGITASAEEDEPGANENEEPPAEITEDEPNNTPEEPGEDEPTDNNDPEDDPTTEPTESEPDNGDDEPDETTTTNDDSSEDDDDTEETRRTAEGGAGNVRKTTKRKTSTSKTSTTETAETSVKPSAVSADSGALTTRRPASNTPAVNTAAISAILITAAVAVTAAVVFVRKRNNVKFEYDSGEETDDMNYPTGALDFNAMYGKYGACALTEYDDRIILTFDPEYDAGHLSQVLDVLKEKKVSGVFFLTGSHIKKQDDLIKRMVSEGHMLGSSGMSEASMPDMKTSALRENIMKLHDYVLQKYGYEMRYLRPPFGEYSKRSLTTAKEMGYTTLMWSFDADLETGGLPDRTSVLERIISSAHGGGVYLFRSPSMTDAEMIGDIIDILRDKGFEL